MIKIERYQHIYISSRTAACYCRLHLLRSSGRFQIFMMSSISQWKMQTRLRMGSAGSPESVVRKKKNQTYTAQKKVVWGATISLSPRVWDRGSKKSTEECADRWGSGGSTALNWSDSGSYCSEVLLSHIMVPRCAEYQELHKQELSHKCLILRCLEEEHAAPEPSSRLLLSLFGGVQSKENKECHLAVTFATTFPYNYIFDGRHRLINVWDVLW